MPPIISSRPGARAMWMGDPCSNSVRSNGSNRGDNWRSRPMWAAKSAGSDKSELMQQVIEDWFDKCLQVPVGVPDPGHIGFGVERCPNRPTFWRCHDHAGLFGDQLRAQIVRMTAVAGG